MQIGPLGLWTFQLELQPASAARDAVAEIEAMGWPTLWIPEALGREAFTHSALLLGATSKLIVATGIANVWARDAMAMANAQRTLTEAYPERFLLGIGVSHAPLVAGVRGHDYAKPLTYMRGYLDAMDAAPFLSVPPSTPLRRVIGALHPGMLKLAGERTEGAHPYFVTPDHTRRARETLGAGPWLCPEQAVCLTTDAATARTVARVHMATYLGLPNYARNLLTLGFTEADLADGGSDRLCDAIVAWGDEEAIRRRVAEHHAAGASHVSLQVLNEDPRALPMADWRRLASALLG